MLLTQDNLVSRAQYLNARNTFEELFNYGTVPVVNENDTVATEQVRFGDNDTLSAQVRGPSCGSAVLPLNALQTCTTIQEYPLLKMISETVCDIPRTLLLPRQTLLARHKHSRILRFTSACTLWQVATLIRAEWLFLLTDVAHLYTANPSVDPAAQPILEVEDMADLQVQTPLA